MIDFEYKSPIQMVMSEFQTSMENDVVKAVCNVGIDINKDELLKALQADRERYSIAYELGYLRGSQPVHAHWIIDHKSNDDRCSNCSKVFHFYEEIRNYPHFDYCPSCGALMDDDDEDAANL